MPKPRTSTKLLAAGSLLCLLAAGENASATNYFNWGVETLRVNYGSTPGKSDVQFFGATVQDCTQGVARSGKCAMRLDIIGNDSGNQQLGADTIQQGPEYPYNIVGAPALYYRWWMKIMPGFTWGGRSDGKTKSSRIIAGAQGYTGYVMNYGFLIGECDGGGCTLNDGSSNNADSLLAIPFDFKKMADGVWREYIVKIKPNSSATCVAPKNCDAEFEAWVDGVSVGQYNGFKLHNDPSSGYKDAWGAWMVRPYFQLNGTSANGGRIYLDDFSIDDVFNSSIKILPPSKLQVQ